MRFGAAALLVNRTKAQVPSLPPCSNSVRGAQPVSVPGSLSSPWGITVLRQKKVFAGAMLFAPVLLPPSVACSSSLSCPLWLMLKWAKWFVFFPQVSLPYMWRAIVFSFVSGHKNKIEKGILGILFLYLFISIRRGYWSGGCWMPTVIPHQWCVQRAEPKSSVQCCWVLPSPLLLWWEQNQQRQGINRV